MRVSDFLRKLLGLSPTSPKPRAMQGGGGYRIRVDMGLCLWRSHRKGWVMLVPCPYL